MGLSNSKKLEILRKAKNRGYRGNYLDLFKKYEEGGLPTVNIPEVEISAIKDETYDKLSQAQKKLYDLYQTPQGTRQTIPITVGKDRKVTQDIHYLDALNLAARNPLTQIRNKPFSNIITDLVQGKPKINRHGQFRAHYVPATKDIYMSPHDANIKDMTAINKYVVVDWDDNPTDMNLGDPKVLQKVVGSGELFGFNPEFSSQREYLESDPARKAQMIKNAKRKPFPEQLEKAASKSLEKAFQEYAHADSDTNHPMQNFFGQVITYGDRIYRGIKEMNWPDASNYNSKFDYEYHTHHSPNSSVNQLVDRYGMDQYDMVNRKPTLGQYNFTIPTGEINVEKLRPDYDPGINKFEHGGSHDDDVPVINVPEVSISALSNESYDRLNQPQRVLYDMYTAPEGGTRQTLPINIGGENRQVGDIHWKDALRMAQNSPRTQIYDTPHSNALRDKDKYMINGDYFRAHAHPMSGNIYVPPSHAYPVERDKSFKDEYGNTFDTYTDNRFREFYIDPRTNKPWGEVELPEGFLETIGTPNFNREGITSDMYKTMYKERGPYSEKAFQYTPDEKDRLQQGKRMSTIIAEYGHTSPEVTNPRDGFPGHFQTIFDRIKRSREEGEWPDASNYQSPEDLEYHTHTAPNSAENQLYDKYNFGRYDLTKPKQKKEYGGFSRFFNKDYSKYTKGTK